MVFVHVDGDYPALVDRPGADLVERLDLYENALRYIRGGSTPWLLEGSLGLGPFVPPLDDHVTHARRTATLERLLARARYVAGPLPLLAAHLADLLDLPAAGAGSLLPQPGDQHGRHPPTPPWRAG